MQYKVVMYLGYLNRAYQVFKDNQDAFRQFLSTLIPLAEAVNLRDMKDIPSYHLRIVKSLQSGNVEEAELLWHGKRREDLKHKQLERLKSNHRNLSYELDSLYSSSSWRLTAPLRRAISYIK